MRPYLSIVTRCCKRPTMLSECIGSVIALRDHDVEQVFIVDRDQVGVARANRLFAENTHRIDGEYVYILDDDTMITDSRFVGYIKKAAKKNPDVIMFRSWRPQLNPHILPREAEWRHPERLKVGSTNCLTYVVRAGLWKENVHAFGVAAGGDWEFLKTLRDQKCSFAWVNQIAGMTQQLGRGTKFEDCKPSWFKLIARMYKLEHGEADDWRLKLWKELPEIERSPEIEAEPSVQAETPEPAEETPPAMSIQMVTAVPPPTPPHHRAPVKHVILGRRARTDS
jgi:hypothetical protein